MINIQNIDDNECFKWYIVRYLNPADHHPARITKTDKDFAEKLDFKDFHSKLETFIKLRKKTKTPSILVFWVMKITSNLCIKKCEE